MTNTIILLSVCLYVFHLADNILSLYLSIYLSVYLQCTGLSLLVTQPAVLRRGEFRLSSLVWLVKSYHHSTITLSLQHLHTSTPPGHTERDYRAYHFTSPSQFRSFPFRCVLSFVNSLPFSTTINFLIIKKSWCHCHFLFYVVRMILKPNICDLLQEQHGPGIVHLHIYTNLFLLFSLTSMVYIVNYCLHLL